jgi:hypothetical protein
MRTGWNPKETQLTHGNVNSASFALLHVTPLDDQVDAQPLVVANEPVSVAGHLVRHDVVYVATENNTVYAIDASSGQILLQRNLGPSVPQASLPGGCGNNGPNVGINGTPVIDTAANTLYVIAFTLVGTTYAYHVHALDLSTLADKVPPVLVTGSHTLANSTTYTFNAAVQRQRPGLLAANDNIYAGFGSFCDIRADLSRGWVLGWKKGTLAALPANQLDNRLATAPNNFFLSSIWMSGYGLSADDVGNLYFVTGNSDWSGTTYNSSTNISETVAKLSPDLTSVLSFFTPSDVVNLEKVDNDFGSGGALVLPPQPGPIRNLLAAAGKNGNLYLMNQGNLGGFHPTNRVLNTVQIGACWCGQSYFSDGVNHVVSSGGTSVTLWQVKPLISSVTLVKQGSTALPSSGQDGGFFTSVSSNGNSNAIIWGVSRPLSAASTAVSLYAFKAIPTLPTLFQAPAGFWPYVNGNANIVPVVANGKVYVASYKQLAIFGLKTPPHLIAATAVAATAVAAAPVAAKELTAHFATRPALSQGVGSEVYGTIQSVDGSKVALKTRTATVEVDVSSALQNGLSVPLAAAGSVQVQGNYDAQGVLHAKSVLRAKASPEMWLEDR